jgi:homoserine dehydrogenase
MLGLGTVGQGVATILERSSARITRRAGRPFEIVRALVRDLDRPRAVALPADCLTTDWRQVVDDPTIELIVELMGGVEPAADYVRAALGAGKPVVTANKALLAERGWEVFGSARSARQVIAFEASVAGGIPIVQAVSIGLAANQIQSISAILNGTCNYILSAMTLKGLSYATALRQAQQLGYAEADPTIDVNGTDSAHKLAILAQRAFDSTVVTADIPRQGIDRLETADIQYSGELGYTIKLLARARLAPDGSIELRVAPRLVRQGTPLADVRDAYNAIRVVGDHVGDALFYGRGAGALPTASAVVSDMIDVVSGRANPTFQSQNLWKSRREETRLTRADQATSRFYLRLTIADRPGVIGQIAMVLGHHQISIASIIQHDPGGDDSPDGPVPLVLMTHVARESAVMAAITDIDRLDVVRAPSVCYGVDE